MNRPVGPMAPVDRWTVIGQGEGYWDWEQARVTLCRAVAKGLAEVGHPYDYPDEELLRLAAIEVGRLAACGDPKLRQRAWRAIARVDAWQWRELAADAWRWARTLRAHDRRGLQAWRSSRNAGGSLLRVEELRARLPPIFGPDRGVERSDEEVSPEALDYALTYSPFG